MMVVGTCESPERSLKIIKSLSRQTEMGVYRTNYRIIKHLEIIAKLPKPPASNHQSHRHRRMW